MTMFKKNGGFTLVELIVVIAILAILAGVAVPAYSGYIEKANEAADLTTLTSIRTAAQGALATKGAIDEIVIQTIADANGKANGTIGMIKVHVAGDPKDTKDNNGVVTQKNYIYLYGINTATEGEPVCTEKANTGLIDYDANKAPTYVNDDFKLFMSVDAPAVLKTNLYGTTWYAADDATAATAYVAGWNEAAEPTT